MKNLLIPILLIALTVGLGCSKDIFQKGKSLVGQEKSLIGKWKPMKAYDPKTDKWEELKRPTDTENDYLLEFFSNGDYGVNLFGLDTSKTYKTDNSVTPNRLIVTDKKSKKETTYIYKFQGERLVLKMATEEKYGVAKDFNTEPNFVIWELERK